MVALGKGVTSRRSPLWDTKSWAQPAHTLRGKSWAYWLQGQGDPESTSLNDSVSVIQREPIPAKQRPTVFPKQKEK